MTRFILYSVHSAYIAGVLALDIVTKMLVEHILVQPYYLFSWLSFELSYNPGVVWGITTSIASIRYIAAGLQSVLVLYIAVYGYYRIKRDTWALGHASVVAGGIGNMLDRFYDGHVVDFIVIGKYPFVWPAFNIADIAIVCGVFCIIWQVISKEMYV